MSQSFQVAVTADLFETPKFSDLSLSAFEPYKWIKARPFDEHRPEIGPDQYGTANGIIVGSPRVTVGTVTGAENLLAIGRFGVGYDNVDVSACTSADVLALTAVGSVDHSMAEATIGWMLALCHNIRAKDNVARTAGWESRRNLISSELRDHTFGAVGLGRIARKTIELLKGFAMNPPIAFDPFLKEADAAALGVRLVSLDRLMSEADFVSVHCPLSDGTRNLIGEKEIALMKPTAFLINTARGGIVNEDALFSALQEQRIAGAALDCFVGEPLTTPPRFGQLDNVLMALHCIGFTHELFRDIGRVACQGMIDLAQGKRPQGVLNPEVFDRPGFQEKWKRLQHERILRS